MNILLVEPFFTGSHREWALGYQQHSQHQVELLTLPGRHWKWRMHGGAVTLARKWLDSDFQPDLILATDMLDLSTFLALTRERSAGIPVALYFHENQLAYPWSPTDQDVTLNRNNHYSFINYTSALSADRIFFNSAYNQQSFLDGLLPFLSAFPDHKEVASIQTLKVKSKVLPLGLDLGKFDAFKPTSTNPESPPLILWNHRWEYDKNPADFFAALTELAAQGLEFEVAVLGEGYRKTPPAFREAQSQLGNRIIQFGYVDSFADYAQWLWRSTILPVTSRQDFFGAAAVEAMYCGAYPLLPNRLAFPEHLSGQPDFYYDTQEELVNRLSYLLTLDQVPDTAQVQTTMAAYDWAQLAPHYDSVMSSFL